MKIARFLSTIRNMQTIAAGRGVDMLARLELRYGKARWRKMKGVARVELQDGTIGWAEVHWYEAHGIGRIGFKVKRMLD